MVVGQKYIILLNSLDPRPHFTQGIEAPSPAFFLNNKSEIPKRNIKKQEKFKKRRQDWNKHYYFIQSLINIMTAMFIL